MGKDLKALSAIGLSAHPGGPTSRHTRRLTGETAALSFLRRREVSCTDPSKGTVVGTKMCHRCQRRLNEQSSMFSTSVRLASLADKSDRVGISVYRKVLRDPCRGVV